MRILLSATVGWAAWSAISPRIRVRGRRRHRPAVAAPRRRTRGRPVARRRRRDRFHVSRGREDERRRRWRGTASTSSSARPAGRPTSRRSAQAVADAGIGVVAAPNFSVGVVLFEAIVARAAALFAAQPEFGAFLHEAHHAAKKDAPSGTALLLKHAMAGGRLHAADRRVVHPRRLHSGDAHRRLRRPGRDDRADAHGARSHRVRARRARRPHSG